MTRGYVSRRAFVAGLASVPVTLWTWRMAAFESGETDASLAALRSFARTIRPQESVAEIGRAYLGSCVDASLEHELARAIWARAPRLEECRAPTGAELRNLVAEAVREDFRNRRIVRVRNWHLAITEARLCALAAVPG